MIQVYTDGSSWKGGGGWAWWVSDDLCKSAGAIDTTNQQMEMLAVIEALERFADEPVEIISDSAYVINGMTQRWYEKWRVNGWRSSSKKDVANRELWEALIELAEARERAGLQTVWTHVRGHQGIPGNEAADKLAGAARKLTEQLGVPAVVDSAAPREGIYVVPRCPRGAERAAMSDDEFWDDVARNLGQPDPDDIDADALADFERSVMPEPCPVCGEAVACAYDAEGRALIHATPEEDE